ncbi:cobyrinate a,c-diamide synthase [Patulibacter sp. NPDC049589]|uniref:cobyrinate a,c-diamide synthase n=1 Tax=Patulibacter sp. NPDC049589 TaxID=3154731 RepID=UPI00342C0FF8
MTARLVIAGTTSGAGKTTVASGLMAAFAARGLVVQGAKVGPDFIDPSYHALATGRPARNLDAFLSGPELVAPLLAHATAYAGGPGAASKPADLAIVEGVMGLYDGATGRGELASTAHVAKLTRSPVILVVDAASMARSVAALVLGYRNFDLGVHVAGVILNKVGSPIHAELLREALEPIGVPVLGALPRDERVEAPSRHLGLVPVGERNARARAAQAVLAERVAEACDLQAIERLARTAPPLGAIAWNPTAALAGAAREAAPVPSDAGAVQGLHVVPDLAPVDAAAAADDRPGGPGAGLRDAGAAPDGPSGGASRHPADPLAPGAAPRIAYAAGAAFTFRYAENLELLRAAGAELVPFDPLADAGLPAGTDALYLGGGFPEEHGAALAENAGAREAVAALAAAGRPIVAECGGLLYLGTTLDDHAMCGVLPGVGHLGARPPSRRPRRPSRASRRGPRGPAPGRR